MSLRSSLSGIHKIAAPLALFASLMPGVSRQAYGQTVQNVKVITAPIGTGAAGYTASQDGGPASAAKISNPYGLATDNSGNLYFVDAGNTRVRMVSASTGIITSLMTNATLNTPVFVAVDGLGNVYVTDSGNHKVFKWTASTATAAAIAGTGSFGSTGDGGLATAATLKVPSGIAVDGFGNIYVADSTIDTVRMISASTGLITTIAGTPGTAGYSGDGGQATAATLKIPRGLTLDAAGNLYIVDGGNNCIRKLVLSTGVITTIAGIGTAGFSGDAGLATAAQLNGPYQVSFDQAGNMYIADFSNYRVRMVNPSGYISTMAGTGTYASTGNGGLASASQLRFVRGVASTPGGTVYISDYVSQTIRAVNSNLGALFPSTALGSTSLAATISLEIITDQTSITSVSLPASQGGSQEFTLTGNSCALNVALSAGTICNLSVSFSPGYPGSRTNSLLVVTNNGTYGYNMTGVGTGPQVVFGPVGVNSQAMQTTVASLPTGKSILGAAVDPAGNYYYSDRTVSPPVVYKIAAGSTSPVAIATLPSTATDATGIAVDGSQNIFVADGTNIVEIPASGSTYGTPTNLISSPSGTYTSIAIDSSDTIYFLKGDTNIYKMAWTGVGSSYNTPVTAATGFTSATALALDSSGALYVANSDSVGTLGVIKVALGGGQTTLPFSFYDNTDIVLGLALDATGSVYASDLKRGFIYEVPFSGGSYGSPVGAAYLGSGVGPAGIAVDSYGNLLVGNGTSGTLVYVNRASGPVITFADALVNTTSSDSPKTLTVSNVGNIALTIPPPAAGMNPSIASNFQFGSSATCPTLSAASSATQLPSGASCTLPISFIPVTASSISGSVVLTDDEFNAVGSMQTVTLKGVGVALTLSPASLGNGVVGTSYSQAFSVTGGTSPYTYAVTSGALPSGITLTTAGVFSGTPTAIGNYNFTVTVTDSDSSGPFSASNSYSVTISKGTQLLTYSPNPAARVYGTAITAGSLNATAKNGNGDSIPGTFTYTSSTGTITAGKTILPAGTYTITASFTPTDTTDYIASSVAATYTVTKVIPVLAYAPNPATQVYGSPISAGSLNASAVSSSGAVIPGTFSYATSTGTLGAGASILPAATYTITATFTPTDSMDYGSGTTTASYVVTKATPVLSFSPNPVTQVYGAAISANSLDATAAASSGVTLPGTYSYTTTSGSVVGGTTVLGVGTYVLTATFTPTDATDYSMGTVTATYNVTKQSPVLTWPNPQVMTYGTAISGIQLNATATNANGSALVGTFAYTTTTGTLTSGVTVLPAGFYTLTATFTSTDATDFANGVITVPLTVNKQGSLTTLSSSSSSLPANTSLTLSSTVTASASGTPTGSVTFLDGVTVLGSGVINNGVATLLTTSLSTGLHAITAAYSGDSSFSASMSSSDNVVIVSPSLSVTASSLTVTIVRGQSGNITLTLTPTGGYTDTLTFACGTLPAYASCKFSPASLTLNGTNTVMSDTLTITTVTNTASLTSPVLQQQDARISRAFLFLPVSALGFLGIGWKKKKIGRVCTLCVLLCASAMIGCAGGPEKPSSSSGIAASGSYNLPITITSTSGLQRTLTMSVVIQ